MSKSDKMIMMCVSRSILCRSTNFLNAPRTMVARARYFVDFDGAFVTPLAGVSATTLTPVMNLTIRQN